MVVDNDNTPNSGCRCTGCYQDNAKRKPIDTPNIHAIKIYKRENVTISYDIVRFQFGVPEGFPEFVCGKRFNDVDFAWHSYNSPELRLKDETTGYIHHYIPYTSKDKSKSKELDLINHKSWKDVKLEDLNPNNTLTNWFNSASLTEIENIEWIVNKRIAEVMEGALKAALKEFKNHIVGAQDTKRKPIEFLSVE
jgi:hypothetical protein